MKTKLFLRSFFILLLLSNESNAQGEANFWYFGDHAGLDFNSGTPVALTNGALSTSFGCASISTNFGALRFYTDGVTVWDCLHNPMPNGTGLMGKWSESQSAIIVPKPGSNNIYYIFTISTTGNSSNGLWYSEVDMSLAGGLGDVTSRKNILLATPISEKITAVKKANGLDFWVIANGLTSRFLVYSVTGSGVNATPVTSNAGSAYHPWGAGYLKASPDGSKLVQAIMYGVNLDVLNFNNATGVVTNDFSFNTPFTFPYGVEFSPDGTRLYVVSSSYPHIYQYNMKLGTSAAIIASETIIGTSSVASTQLGALQLAPDGKIYFAKYDEGTLGCINNPNMLGTNCGFVDSAINLLGKTSKLGLPNFIQTYFNPPITYVNTCVGDTTYFSLLNTTDIDSVIWNFNDPTSGVHNTSSLLNPSHIYSSIGTYAVSAITHVGSITNTLSVQITIMEPPIFTIGNDTALCIGASIILDPGAGYSSYLWQNSSRNQTLTATTAGIYYVDVTNTCETTTDSIHIAFLSSPIVVDDIIIPNVFTPNGDGNNDLFIVKNLQPGIASIKIYNRWENIVYESSGYNNDWNGQNVKDGVYYYILDYHIDEKIYTGYVQIISGN
jgi:gliding motility-associated-like protein